MNTELASLDVLHGTLPRDQQIPGYVDGAKSHVFRKRTLRFLLAKVVSKAKSITGKLLVNYITW